LTWLVIGSIDEGIIFRSKNVDLDNLLCRSKRTGVFSVQAAINKSWLESTVFSDFFATERDDAGFVGIASNKEALKRGQNVNLLGF
jgi:hypothetical protein